jgi:hypothetical protein
MKVLFIGGLDAEPAEGDDEKLRVACRRLGRALQQRGHSVVFCSTFAGAADIDVLRGVADAADGEMPQAFAHVPENAAVERLGEIERELPIKVARQIYRTPDLTDDGSRSYAYLTCQLPAMDAADAVIAIGGRQGGASSLFLLIAEKRGKPLIPVPFLRGAAHESYWRIMDTNGPLTEDLSVLDDPTRIGEAVTLAERLADRPSPGPDSRFFISYSHRRAKEADVVENLLRRSVYRDGVFRDEADIQIGDRWRSKIAADLARTDVFVALWSQEYACSQHCFDEMAEAIRRRQAGIDARAERSLEIWVFKLDDTPITFPEVRELDRGECLDRRQLQDAFKIRLQEWTASAEARAALLPGLDASSRTSGDGGGSRP